LKNKSPLPRIGRSEHGLPDELKPAKFIYIVNTLTDPLLGSRPLDFGGVERKDRKVTDAALTVTDDVTEFWSAHPDALFSRKTVARVRRCSVALLEREAWDGTGIRIVRDGRRCLYRKSAVLRHLGLNLDSAP
jgi:hypothetical protein